MSPAENTRSFLQRLAKTFFGNEPSSIPISTEEFQRIEAEYRKRYGTECNDIPIGKVLTSLRYNWTPKSFDVLHDLGSIGTIQATEPKTINCRNCGAPPLHSHCDYCGTYVGNINES